MLYYTLLSATNEIKRRYILKLVKKISEKYFEQNEVHVKFSAITEDFSLDISNKMASHITS